MEQSIRPMLSQMINPSFTRFIVTGLVATLCHMAVLMLLVKQFGYDPTLATVPAFSAALILSYLVNHRWTFARTGRHSRYFPRFVLVALSGLLLNMVIVYSCNNLFALPWHLTLIIIAISIPLLSFICHRLWTFADDD